MQFGGISAGDVNCFMVRILASLQTKLEQGRFRQRAAWLCKF